ncbi:MAG: RC-LH1 core complex protein PufX [Pseudorhodobacter sp.]
MSDNDFIKQTRGTMLRSWVLGEMLRGAGYAALALFAVGVFIYAIYLLGLLLPEESKQAPSPYGFQIEAPAKTRLV